MMRSLAELAAWRAFWSLFIVLTLAGCESTPRALPTVARAERTPAEGAQRWKAAGPFVPSYCITESTAPVHARCMVKLGMVREEAAALLTERQRMFVDGVRRIYTEPGVLIQRREALAALGAQAAPVCRRPSTGADATTERQGEVLKTDALFSRNPFRRSRYMYSTTRIAPGDDNGRTWTVWLAAALETRGACLPSRAVEGYLDVPLSSRVVKRKEPPQAWDRHGPGIHRAVGEQLSEQGPRMEMHIVDGCVTDMYFMFDSDFVAGEVSDEVALY